MMDTVKGLYDQFNDKSRHPAMAMLKPDMSLVGSMPEGTRAGDVVEIDVMMKLNGFKKDFLSMSQSATKLSLNEDGKTFFGRFTIITHDQNFAKTSFMSIIPKLFMLW